MHYPRPPALARSQIRARYARTLGEQEAELQRRRKVFSAHGATEQRTGAYARELGPSSYKASQLEAYKVCRRIVDEFVSEVRARVFAFCQIASASAPIRDALLPRIGVPPIPCRS